MGKFKYATGFDFCSLPNYLPIYGNYCDGKQKILYLVIREIIVIKDIIGILHRPTQGETDCCIGQRDLTLSAINPIRDS